MSPPPPDPLAQPSEPELIGGFQPDAGLTPYDPATQATEPYGVESKAPPPPKRTSTMAPVAPPARPSAGRRGFNPVAVLVVAVVLLVGAVAFLVVRPTAGPPPAGTTSSAPAAGSVGAAVHLADPAVTEAIDLPNQPMAGQSWLATDAIPDDQGLVSHTIVTPCGVFVTVLQTPGTPDPAAPNPASADARILGYDIASGRQLWTIETAAASGLIEPRYDWALPTYTPSCVMVLRLDGSAPDGSGSRRASLAIHLDSGANFALPTGPDGQCDAVDDDWGLCWQADDSLWLVSLTDPTASPIQWPSGRTLTYTSAGGDMAVAGAAWTPQGYVDPASGQVVFGADANLTLNSAGQIDAGSVVYLDPRRPGGYRSGLAVRVEWLQSPHIGLCQFQVWDTAQDKPAWAKPGTAPCGQNWQVHWSVAGNRLIVSVVYVGDLGDTRAIQVYDLSNGRPLWLKSGGLSTTPWNTWGTNELVPGLSETYASLFDTPGAASQLVRLADGVVQAGPPDAGSFATSPTMGYVMTDTFLGDAAFTMAAYRLDPTDPSQTPVAAWRLTAPLSFKSDLCWTFVSDGVMYVVNQSDAGQVELTPLVE